MQRGQEVLERRAGQRAVGVLAARRLDAHAQRGHVEQEQVLDRLGLVAAQDGRLDCGAVGHGLVRVDRLVELFACEILCIRTKNE